MPIVGNRLKRRTCVDAGIWIPLGGVVDHRAHLADPLARDRLIGLAGYSLALQGLEGNAIGFGVMLLDRGQQAEVLGGGAEQAGMLPGFAALLGEFSFGSAVSVLLGLAVNSGYIVVYS